MAEAEVQEQRRRRRGSGCSPSFLQLSSFLSVSLCRWLEPMFAKEEAEQGDGGRGKGKSFCV
jgi:hypothetical protein